MAGYIGSKASVVSNGAERKKVFDITTTTTSLTGLAYTLGQVHVFHNGVRLVDGTDYTATTGTSITLTVAAESGDQVAVVSYATFQTSDTVSASAGGTFGGAVTVQGAFTSLGIDDNATSTAMTIDSSGHLLIGKTADDNTTTGTAIHDNGFMSISRSADIAMILDRSSNEGEILRLTEAGTERGSLHINNDRMLIDSAGDASGLRFDAGGYTPFKNGSAADGTVDLGFSAGRFKDAYLSGGVYLGGTVAANLLEDYEEGTFTATWIGTGTSGPSATMRYTKIGNTVNIVGVTQALPITPTGAIELSGLPFTPNSSSSGSILYRNITPVSGQQTLIAYVGNSTANIQLYWSSQGTYAKLEKSQINSAGAQDMYIGVTYTTNA